MRILFAGTPEIAVPSLEKCAQSYEVVAALTGPDKKKGRGKKVAFSPVKEKALELGIPVLQPSTLKRRAREEIAPLEADILVVYAYGRIFGPKFLSLFPQGAINVHPSLLPIYRGGSPIVAPILNGDKKTGVVVQAIGNEVDAGAILGRRYINLTGKETGESLSRTMAEEGSALLIEVIRDYHNRKKNAEEQNGREVVFTRKLDKRDGEINWNLPASMIERMTRAYYPWPKAYTFAGGKRLTLHDAQVLKTSDAPLSSHTDTAAGSGESNNLVTSSASISVDRDEILEKSARWPGTILGMDRHYGILVQTGDGVIGMNTLQLEGKKPVGWKEFLNGNPDFLSLRLGDKI